MGTFSASSARDFRPGNVEIPFNNIAGHPYLENQLASMAVFNKSGSGLIVTINDVFFKDLSSPNSTAISSIDFQRITAYTGGDEIKIPIAMDSNNASLPAQVTCVEDADTVTTTGTLLRTINNIPFFSDTQTLPNNLGSLMPGQTNKGFNRANFLYSNFATASAVQGQILREGQGFAIIPRSGNVYQSIKYKVIIKFRNVSTNACYTISEAIILGGNKVPLAFLNGTGSGVILEIYHVDLIEVGSQTFPNLFSVERIEGLTAVGAFVASPTVSHDSTNESLSGKVDAYCDCNVTIAGGKMGAIVARPILARDWQTAIGGGTVTVPNFGARWPKFLKPNDTVSNMILREGEGIAVFKRTLGSIGKSSVVIVFTTSVAGGTVVAGATNYAYLS